MQRQDILSFSMLLFLGSFLLSFSPITAPVFASSLKINEVLVHPGSGNSEWVEIYNPDKTDISSFYIDDDTDFNSDTGNSSKKILTGIQGTDTQFPYFELTSSMFNNNGDNVVLFDNNGIMLDQYLYLKDPGIDVSLGRSPDGTGEIMLLAAATKGMANSQMQPSPTPTPTKVPTSTPSPKPTPTTKPANTPTSIKSSSPTNTPTPKITKGASYAFPTKAILASSTTVKTFITPDDTGSESSVLGDATKSSQKVTTIIKIANASTQKELPLPILLMGGGMTLFAGCGILLLWSLLKKKNDTSSE